MKIWIINQFANTPDQPGHTRQFEIAKGLSSEGWEINVFSSDFNLSTRKYYKQSFMSLYKVDFYNSIKWTWLRVIGYKKNNWKRIINLISFSLHLLIHLFTNCLFSFYFTKKPSLILASSPQLPASFISLIVAKIFKIPFLLEVRDLWPQVLIDQGGLSKNNIIIKLLFLMEKYLYKNASSIIILSKGVKKYIQNRGGKNIFWLPNGPDKNFFIKRKYKEINKNFSLKNPFKIYYSGAHGEANDLNNIIDTANLLKSEPIFFTFIGDGTCKKSLIKKAKNLPNVKFIDPVPKSTIPVLLSKADAILVSLGDVNLFTYGVSPNKLYDAYALGKPVITTVPGIINDEVQSNCLGVTSPPKSPLILSKVIRELVNLDPKQRYEMGSRARKLARNIYSRQLVIKKYLKIIYQITK